MSETTTLRERLARYSINERVRVPADPDARLSQHQRQPEELITSARERYHHAPDDLPLVDWLAYLLYANRRHAEAIPLFEKLVRSPSATALHHFHLGNSYHAVGQTERAVDRWELVARRFPDTDVARKALSRLRYLYLGLRKAPATPARAA